MAWTTPRTWAASETVTASLMNTHLRDNLNYLKTEVDGGLTMSKGGTFFNDNGIDNTARAAVVWRATRACTITAVKGWRGGGTGATINARKNGSSTFLSSALSLTSANSWMDGGTVQNTSIVSGDAIEIVIVTTAGDPEEIGVQVEMTPD
jgi:hypothetical protein